MLALADRVVIVTGGGTGIGKGISLAFARAGANVVVTSRKMEHLEPVAAEIQKLGRSALAVPTDVRVPEQVENMVKQTMDKFGRIDVLVNNAGASFLKPVEEYTPNGWDTIIAINLKGPWLCSKYVFSVMKQQKRGVIINIASIAGVYGSPRRAPYGASKAGLINLTKTMANEWGKYNIRVTCIAPGTIVTEALKSLWTPAELKNRAKNVPLGRLGEVDEIGATAVFLASDGAGFITGETINVDGGFGTRKKDAGDEEA